MSGGEPPSVSGAQAAISLGRDALGDLPRLDRPTMRWLSLTSGPFRRRLERALGWLTGPLGSSVVLGTPEVAERLSGLQRPGAVVVVLWASRGLSLGFHVETPLAHALVDRMLGYERPDAQARLQITPVEWGVLTYSAARTLAAFVASAHPDLVLERVGPDPFRPEGQRAHVTLLWPVRVGGTEGLVRAWVPAGLMDEVGDGAAEAGAVDAATVERFGGLTSSWRAVAGAATMPRGLARLRVGGVLPIDGSPLRGTATAPEGAVELVLATVDGRYVMPGRLSGGGRVVVEGTRRFEAGPRERATVSNAGGATAGRDGGTPDVPVTLVVELGRVSLPLSRLADLKPGDLIDLARHSREPVELTSNGRLVARGELVQIDTELGVRITNVLL